MPRFLRHLAAVGTLTASVMVAYHFAAGSAAAVASVGGTEEESGGFGSMLRNMAVIGGGGYDLSALRNLQRVDALVDQQYVDAGRIDYNKMYRSSLVAVEREIPGVMLQLDAKGDRLEVSVGNFHTTLTVQKLDKFATLEAELRRVAAILEDHVDPKEVEFPDIEYTIINGVLGTLDPHSVFLPPEGSKKMQEDNEGEFGGLGITINIENNQLTIQYPLMDTPAYRAGLQADDRILKIEGEETLNMDLDEAVSKMRGPPGSKITITVSRKGWETPRDFTVVRDKIKPAQVWGQLMPGTGVAYINIPQFHAQVESQLDELLTQYAKEAGGSLKGVVLDLRNNPGGYLHQAVAVVDKFIAEGVIVSTVERNGRNREEKEARAEETEPNYPMVVLMSGTSASASEIVAGALKNQERAVIMGERSFGKGSVQNLYPFNDESKLKLTVARYLTPGDHSIQNVGIPADIELESSVIAPPIELKDPRWAIPPAKAGDKPTYPMSGPRISLFHRDRYLEEADLEGHLTNDEDAGSGPAYSVRYLAPDPHSDAPRSDRPDPTKDFEVMFATDVVQAAKDGRRADVLKSAEKVVAARQKAEDARVMEAFKSLGINWSPCVNPAAPNAVMDLKIDGDGILHPGKLATVTLTVTNKGTTPLCQASAKSTSGNDALNGLEFYLGRIEPGASRSFSTRAVIEEGYPTEIAGVNLTLRDIKEQVLATNTITIRSEGVELPRYGWSWSFNDKDGGNGNGIPEVGETVTMNVAVENLGPGVGGDLVVTLKKDVGLGKSVVLQKGTFTVSDLAPGAKGSGELSFKVVSKPEEMADLPFELRVQETRRYDYASIMKAQFGAYFTESETVHVPLGSAPAAGSRQTPNVVLSRTPELTVTDGRATISGVATDEAGIRDVIIYHGEDKIAYFGGGDGLKSVPFSATADLTDGTNLIVVLVRDVNGLTTTRAVDVYKPPAPVAKKE